MKNRELRKQLLEDGTFREYTEKRKELIDTGQAEEMDLILDKTTGEVISKNKPNGELFGMEQSIAEECEGIRKCRDKQRKKIQDHIRFMLINEYDVFFTTMTLTDDALQKSDRNQKRAINRCYEICEDYLYNVDYGKTTGRKHFHGVIAMKPGTYTLEQRRDKKGHLSWHIPELEQRYHNGFIGIEPFRGNSDEEKDKSAEKIAKYETKLTQHSLKVQQSYVTVKKGTEYQQHKGQRDWQLNHIDRLERFLDDQMEKKAWNTVLKRTEDYMNSEECPF